MNALGAKFEKRLKRLPTTTRVEADDHVEAPAEGAQNPKGSPLLSMENVRRSHPMTILKPTGRLRFNMPMHHADTTAGNYRGIGEVCGYRLTEWVVKSLR
ncbi:hypothetical protein [Pseudomonas sp. D(2018)]|uniref:hypothetical protein n=1 Tax=Pseudomonas sp. D(2018) TaxID=2502238 RepID=UPI0014850DC1|nr:hypothetical protein [Pseudomonas sp. D(2018)]